MILQMTPFIMLDGQAKEAIRFYEDVLDAKVVFSQTFGEAPDAAEYPVPDETRNRLAHSVLKIGEAELFVSDTFPGQPSTSGNAVSICVTTSNKEHTERCFESLTQEGTVSFPLQPTHFSPAYAVVTDKFGVTFLLFTKR